MKSITLVFAAWLAVCLSMLTCSLSYGQGFTEVTSFPADQHVGSDRMAQFGDNLYMFLRRDDAWDITSLTRFDGTSFREIPLPADYVAPSSASQLEVMNGKLYMILRERDPIPGLSLAFRYHLFSYNGTFTRISLPFPGRRIGYLDKIQAYDGKLHFATYDTLTYDVFWTTFDGVSSFTSQPWPDFHYTLPSDMEILNGKLYKLAGIPTPGEPYDEVQLLEYDGTTFTMLPLPDAATHIAFEGPDMEVYNGALYFLYLNTETSSYGLVKFDGTAFTYLDDVFPADRSIRVRFFKSFSGKLHFVMTQPLPSHEFELYAFDGTSTERVVLPSGTGFVEPRLHIVYNCNLYFTLKTREGDEYVNHFYAYGPSRGCRLFAIPDRLRQYERVIVTGYAPERDWCWTGIDVDWIIQPVCPVLPCPDPPFTTTLTDLKGKVAWQKTFEKPFNTSIPLADVQPYSLSVATEKDGVTGEVMVFDSDLVKRGIEKISVEVNAADEYFRLYVSTEKQAQIPLTISFRDENGKELWSEKLVAPLDKDFSPFVSEQGAYYQFSAEGGSSNVTYYPNPASGKLYVENRNKDINASISLSDLNGQTVFSQGKLGEGVNILDISGVKPGLYLISAVEGGYVRKELFRVK